MIRGKSRWLTAAAAAVVLSLLSGPALAGPGGDARMDGLEQRLFPLLDRLADAPALTRLRRSAPALPRLLNARRAREEACGTDALCAARSMLWTDAESAALRDTLAPLAAGIAPDDGAAAGLDREIAGLNMILRTYGLGEKPRYPEIDGPGIPADGAEAGTRRLAALALARTPRTGAPQNLDPSIDFALALLDVNDRTDAAGFEPLTGGTNAAAIARAQHLDWNRYRYGAMIVTGVGPEVPDMPLSPLGKYHVRLAANRFARGDIPFIILTGGRAHPRATPFAEAVEMREALIGRYGIPADAIVIEPYARHTTTNLRNAARLLAALGAPATKAALIVCNPVQSAYIESAAFAQRNQKELGYQPGRTGERLAPTEIEFYASARSARVDPRDPLDP